MLRSVHSYGYENSRTKVRSELEVALCASIYSNEKLKSVLKLTPCPGNGYSMVDVKIIGRLTSEIRNYISFCRFFTLLKFMLWNGRLHWNVEALQIEYYSALLHGIFYSPLEGGSQCSNWGVGSMTEGRRSIPSGATHFYLPQRVYISSGWFKPPTKRVPWAPFQGVNRPSVKLTTYKRAVPKLRLSYSPVPSTKNFTVNFLVH
jgi:hypothetical protein